MKRFMLLLAALVLVATSGCAVLDTINRLPGIVAGKPDVTQVDYSKVENMPDAMTAFAAALNGDRDVWRLTMGNQGAEVFTHTQSLEYRKGKVVTGTDLHPIASRGKPLSAFDPAAAMIRLTSAAEQRGCTSPSRIAMTVYATGQIISDITCTLDGEPTQLVEGPAGDLVGAVDMTTRDGIKKAVADVLAVNVPGARYTVFAFQYDTSSGTPYLLAQTGRVHTLRQAEIRPDVPALFQSDSGVDPTATAFDITGITADTFVTVYEAAKRKCGDVSLLHIVLATNGQPMFLSGTFSCPYQADRTGKPI